MDELGEHTVVARATDEAGNVAEESVELTIREPGPGNDDELCPEFGIPADRISIQLYTFAGSVDFGDVEQLEQLFAGLEDAGYRTVEPYGQPYSHISAEDLADLMAAYDIRAVSSHGSQDLESFEATVAYAAALGQDYIGAGGPPGDFSTYEGTLEMAETLNTLGQMAVDGGVEGGILVHNHQDEFRTTHGDVDGDGETKSVWQLLVENTDSEYIGFEVDTLWAANAGVDVPDLIREHGERIAMLHVKDGTNLDAQRATITQLGEGDLDFEAIFEAAWPYVDHYAYEYDRAPDAMDLTAEAFEFLDCIELDIDETAPQVSVDLAGDTDDEGHFVNEVTVSIDASDDGSGVATVEYRLDGGDWIVYDGPFTVDESGDHTVEARATDEAGNVSEAVTETFTVVEDECPDGDDRATVVIDGIDSQVDNVDTGDGCTIADLIDEDGDWRNHGQFVSHVDHLLDELQDDGLIDDDARDRINSAAARSDVGKPEAAKGKGKGKGSQARGADGR